MQQSKPNTFRVLTQTKDGRWEKLPTIFRKPETAEKATDTYRKKTGCRAYSLTVRSNQ